MPLELSPSHLNVTRVVAACSRDLYSQKMLSLESGRLEQCAGAGERVGERLERPGLASKWAGETDGDILQC